MSFERFGVLYQLIRNTTKKWFAKINFWGHKGMYQGLCCFYSWAMLFESKKADLQDAFTCCCNIMTVKSQIPHRWSFEQFFYGLITVSPTVTGGNRWWVIMIFCIENQKLCLTSVQFKQVLRHPPVDISYAGLKFDPRFCQFQFNDDSKIKT